MMNESLKQLLVVQEKDKQIFRIRDEIGEVPNDRHKIRSYLDKMRFLLDKERAKLDALVAQITELEAKLDTRSTTLVRLKTQLIRTRKQEEFDEFTQDISKYEKEIDAIETQLLESMDQKTVLEEECKKQEEKFRVARFKGKVAGDKLDEKLLQLQQELTKEEERRSEMVKAIDPFILDRYQRMLQKPGFPVVAQVSDKGLCSGCHMKLTASQQNAARIGTDYVFCDNCGRILV